MMHDFSKVLQLLKQHSYLGHLWLVAESGALVWPSIGAAQKVLAAEGDVFAMNVEESVVVVQVVLPVLKDLEAKHSKAALGEVSSAITSTMLEYVAALCSTLIWVKNFEPEDWEKVRRDFIFCSQSYNVECTCHTCAAELRVLCAASACCACTVFRSINNFTNCQVLRECVRSVADS